MDPIGNFISSEAGRTSGAKKADSKKLRKNEAHSKEQLRKMLDEADFSDALLDEVEATEEPQAVDPREHREEPSPREDRDGESGAYSSEGEGAPPPPPSSMDVEG